MELSMRLAAEADADAVLDIYNSNPDFLLHHLGLERVDAAFLRREQEEMRRVGFSSCVLTGAQDGLPVGVLDYRPGDCAYLSLLMLHRAQRGVGLGRACYAFFERYAARQGSRSIRIDVVDDYEGNALPFWERQGFCARERTELLWGEKRSRAVVMSKNLR